MSDMNYSSVVSAAEAGEICIQPHVIPLGMAWRMSDVEVVEDITWSDVCAQTELKLDDSDLAWLEGQPPENQLQFLVEDVGYKGVLLIVTSHKRIAKSLGSGWRYIERYAYLPSQRLLDWAEIGTELGKLIQQVLASWEDKAG